MAIWARLVEPATARRGATPGFARWRWRRRASSVRSTLLGNPITVLRRRDCTAGDIAELHAILGYEE
jgi:hypothetical protein